MVLRMMMVTLMVAMSCAVSAQRRVTPVKPAQPGTVRVDKDRDKEVDRSRLVTKRDQNGHEILVDTVTGKEFVDSVAIREAQKHKPMLVKLWNGVSVGVNLWDPIMRIFGQKYGVASVWGEVNLHNRYLPTLELGLGTCSDTPSGLNYTYKSPLAPFFKIGCKYNFLYNSNQAYMAYAGIFYGFTPFKFSVDDVNMPPGYWDDPEKFSIPSHSCTAGYLDISFGIRVKLVSRLSAGWELSYKRLLNESDCPSGKPMYIPGYGKRSGHLAGSLSLSWKL